MNRQCNVTKRVKIGDSLRYCPVKLSANGKIKPDVVIVNGHEERHPEGAYYLEWREGAKRVRLSVGNNAADATTRRLRKEAELAARNNGVAVVDPEGKKGRGATLAASVAEYLEEIELSKKATTHMAYKTALGYFLASCHKVLLTDIDRKDMLRFAAYLRDEKHLAPRSCWNSFNIVQIFLNTQGIKGIVSKNDWPRFTQEVPEVYSTEETDKFFSACTPEQSLWFQTLLQTGLREQEWMYLYFSDIDFNKGTITPHAKPDRGWSPKAYKERTIPVGDSLLNSLREHRTKAGTCPLVFPTSNCNLKRDLLDNCKAIAARAGLDPDGFWLHKFRATFATRCLQANIDLRTVQSWLGHADLTSTMRYLRPAEGVAVREKVSAIFG